MSRLWRDSPPRVVQTRRGPRGQSSLVPVPRFPRRSGSICRRPSRAGTGTSPDRSADPECLPQSGDIALILEPGAVHQRTVQIEDQRLGAVNHASRRDGRIRRRHVAGEAAPVRIERFKAPRIHWVLPKRSLKPLVEFNVGAQRRTAAPTAGRFGSSYNRNSLM